MCLRKKTNNKPHWQTAIKLGTEMKCMIGIIIYLHNYLFSLQILTIHCKLACLRPTGTVYIKIKPLLENVLLHLHLHFAM